MKTISIIILGLVVALSLLALVVDFLLPALGLKHETIWENWHLLFIGLGLLGTLALINFAKEIVNKWLGRRDDYYD